MGVAVEVAIDVEGSATFATVTCSGSAELAETDSSPVDHGHLISGEGHRLVNGFPFLIPPEVDTRYESRLADVYQLIGGVLEQVGSLIRWRFKLSGQDAVFRDEH